MSVLRALELDPTLPEAHIALGDIHYSYDWDWSGAEREIKRALELDPNNGTAHHRYAWYLTHLGRHKEALAEAKKARDLDPLSPIITTAVGSTFYFARQYDRAIEELRTITDSDPSFWVARLWLAHVYLKKGLLKQAVAEYEEVAGLSDGHPSPLAWLGYAYAASGRRVEAHRILARLKQRSKQGYVPSYEFAVVHIGLRDYDEAFRWLEKAYAERYFALTFLKMKPIYDPLRSDPRFQDLLRRMNFPE